MSTIQSIARSLMIIHHRLAGRYGPLTRPQLRILSSLKKSKRTVSELAEYLQISSSGVTQALDKLQIANYIVRQADPNDQRVVQISDTEMGRLALQEAERHYEYRVTELLQTLSEEQQQTLSELLAELVYSKPMRNKKNEG